MLRHPRWAVADFVLVALALAAWGGAVADTGAAPTGAVMAETEEMAEGSPMEDPSMTDEASVMEETTKGETMMDEPGELVLEVAGLEDLGPGWAYEGWLIVNGSPLSTGVFTVDAEGNPSVTTFHVAADDLSEWPCQYAVHVEVRTSGGSGKSPESSLACCNGPAAKSPPKSPRHSPPSKSKAACGHRLRGGCGGTAEGEPAPGASGRTRGPWFPRQGPTKWRPGIRCLLRPPGPGSSFRQGGF